MLKETGIPTAEYDCDLASYVDICCTLLDIPIYKSRVITYTKLSMRNLSYYE